MELTKLAASRLGAVIVAAALAAGCGGGGGGGGVQLDPPVLTPEPPPVPQVLTWDEFAAARTVIGQGDFDDGEPPFNGPVIPLDRLIKPKGGVGVTADGRLFVGDDRNLKMFASYDSANGSAAQFAMGGAARHVSVQGSRLVASQDNRVEIYSTLPTDANAVADIAIGGQAGCSANRFNAPGAAFITPQGRLIVADTLNNRVLIWTQIPVDGEAPNFVVGQRDMISCVADAINDDGTGDSDSTSSAQTLNMPTSVWSNDTRLVVVDSGNSRVLIWETFPDGDFRAASHVIGQTNFFDGNANFGQANASNASFSSPVAVDVRESGQMAVADTGNNRVLVWDTFPSSDGQAATQVIGQSGFTGRDENAGGAVPAENTLNGPTGVRFDGRNLVVTDTGNHRVLVFRATN
jgi:hypothetical protein